MQESFYVLRSKITPKVQDLILSGYHIKVGEKVYERLSSKPRGKKIERSLLSIDGETRFVLYS